MSDVHTQMQINAGSLELITSVSPLSHMFVLVTLFRLPARMIVRPQALLIHKKEKGSSVAP